jgi:hypothetical protein
MMQYPRAKGSPSGLSDPLLRLWRLADGRTPLADIARAADTSFDQVLAGLDLLDHVGLLARDPRAAPGPDLPGWALAGRDATERHSGLA